MKSYQKFILLISITFMFFPVLAQNQLRVNTFASSVLSEGSFSWFMDHEKISGSQLAVQVRDLKNGELQSGCAIQIEAFQTGHPELKVSIPSSDIREVQKGLYVMTGSGGLFNAAFNQAGSINMRIAVQKPGCVSAETNYVFNNMDYLGGYYNPLAGSVMSAPVYLSTRDDDPRSTCRSANGTYYAVWFSLTDKQKKTISLIVPVNKNNNQIPADWPTYQETARALAISSRYDLFNPETAIKFKDDISKLQKQLPVIQASGKSIEFLVPLLNSLVKGAVTGGASIYYDAQRTVAKETSKFLLSQASNVTNYTDGFFYHQIQQNLNNVQDTINLVISTMNLMKSSSMQLNTRTAAELYRMWKYVLVTIATTTDLAENKLLGKSTGKKMLEEQVKYLIGSKMAQEVKFVQMANYLQTTESALLSSMKESKSIVNSLYNSFDYHWDENGPARNVFQQAGGKTIREDFAYILPCVNKFSCEQNPGITTLRWESPKIQGAVSYVIKYSKQPITDQNWNMAYYVMTPDIISANSGMLTFRPGERDEREGGLYFAIKYVDEKGKSSIMATASCMQKEQNEKQEEVQQKVASNEQQWKSPQVEQVENVQHKDPFVDQMVYVEGGCFWMGTSIPDFTDAQPTHQVCLDHFYIGKTEVTQQQWISVMGSNPSRFKGCGDCPVENVTWDEVQAFIQKLNRLTGKNYRLPSEAEWEYAAMGGQSRLNAGFVRSYLSEAIAWFANNSEGKTHPVGQKEPNLMGLYDWMGNVFEWCSDWYDPNYYSHSPKDSPAGPSTGKQKVIRGGSWTTDNQYLSIWYRAGIPPQMKTNNCGFRLCLEGD